MKWRIDRTLHAPASALPLQERTWPSVLTLSRPRFTVQPAASDDDLSRTVGLAIGDPAFSVWEAESTWEKLPPPPWQTYLVDAPLAELVGNLGYGEIALTLRLLPMSEWRRREPLIPADLSAALQVGGPLPQRLREGFAFALFEPSGPWHSDDELLTGWTQAVRATLHQRHPLARALKPNSRWLALGYRLLETLSQQRTHRPTLAEVEAGWQALQPADGPALPHMFAVVYWGEGAYRLLECGDTAGASAALNRQTTAAQALIKVLPDLAEALDGGLWRHHLGQLAYYRGDFPEALRQFQQEWRLQSQRPATALHARLRRSLSSLLNDMGLLASARRLTEDSLVQQRHGDDPELFKTLGRLGEIQLRQGDYPAARAAYEESWQRQPEGRREGRTAVYLGHLALLENCLVEAETWYETAEQADLAQDITFNPYLVMGRIALAWRQGDLTGVRQRWNQHREALDALQDEKVLPAAVAALAVTLATANPDLAGQSVERLLAAHYLLEALCPLARCAPTPKPVAPGLQRIADTLQQWQQALEAAASDIHELDPDEDSAPGPVAARIEAALAANDWRPLAADRAHGFPMNLLGNEPLMRVSANTSPRH
jgi:tetratricopeptide (TPR) repeat protein